MLCRQRIFSCRFFEQFIRAIGITFRHVGEILSKIFSVKKMTHIESYLHESAENSEKLSSCEKTSKKSRRLKSEGPKFLEIRINREKGE
jgi:hypothetical protein